MDGSFENNWLVLSTRLPLGLNQRLTFTATRGNGYQGDIAVDEIIVSPDVCVEQGESSKYFMIKTGLPRY